MPVVITGRDGARVRSAAARLGIDDHHVIDVTDRESIDALRGAIDERFGKRPLILINNAAIYADEDATILDVPAGKVLETFETNTIGALNVSQAFVPMMKRAGRGVIVNVSSQSGQISTMGFDTPAYRLSKLALNGVTVMLSHALSGYGIRVNSVCPGWVRTEMGGPNAPRSVEEGASDIVWVATEAGSATGKFFVGREVALW